MWTAVLRVDEPPSWLVFETPSQIIDAWTPADIHAAIAETEDVVSRGRFAVMAMTYEAAAAFGLPASDPIEDLPLVRVLVFEPSAVRRLDRLPAGDAWSIDGLAPVVTRGAFHEAFARIRDALAAGDSYQVNYTFPLRGDFHGDPFALFVDLAEAQQGSLSAFVRTGRYTICSASPELFFSRDGDEVVACPMKGTARRGRTTAEDEQIRASLVRSVKDRAENVMIVDMMRNDIGRVAEIGSVEVRDLFDTARYPTVWQMTSTVTARSRAPLADLLAAVFPAASVTGAPKARTMELIRQLEKEPRGIYTGAIGLLEPGGRARFSVAIRTAVVDRERAQVEFRVGSGIVWDSDPDREYDECLLKGRILGARPRPFELLETMRWSPAGGFDLLDRHLARMRDSAEFFGISPDEAKVARALQETVAGAARELRVRLLVGRDGHARAEASPLKPLPDPARVAFANAPVDPLDPFLFHKTTRREIYERAQRPGADETLLWNPAGELTEAATANVVIEIDGRRVTPPVESGLLPGTLRAELLARGEIVERRVPMTSISTSTPMWLINSVRGWRRATLIPHDER